MKPGLESLTELLRERLPGLPSAADGAISSLAIMQWDLDSLDLLILIQTLVEYSPKIEHYLDHAGENFVHLTLAEIHEHM